MSHALSRAVGYDVSAYLYRGVLVDTGYPLAAPEVERLLAERRPAGVAVTHRHEDHAGNVELVARLGVPLLAAPATLDAVRRAERIGFYRRVIWGPPPALVSTVTPFEPEGLALVPTPGHSPDHHVLWDAATDTVFGGDLFLGVKVRVAHPWEDPRQIAASVRRVAALRPRRLFDAHRGAVADPVAALLAKADWIEETVAAIERRAAAGWSARAVCREVLGREDLAAWISRGDYSRLNFVRAVLARGRT
jgi:glyoxylase-like metal-dependent hydrolase (beta-lactamase superfamily II)